MFSSYCVAVFGCENHDMWGAVYIASAFKEIFQT